LSETEFITQLKNQTRASYNKLIDDFQQKVFATCISFVPNREDAEDIAQEVFVEVFNSISNFKGQSRL
jgi:DNA-directed RNA polymerase specialized sigma24 family protein